MLSPLNTNMNGQLRFFMDEMTPQEREYEALAIARDMLLVLCKYIEEANGDGCPRLHDAYEFVERQMTEAANIL